MATRPESEQRGGAGDGREGGGWDGGPGGDRDAQVREVYEADVERFGGSQHLDPHRDFAFRQERPVEWTHDLRGDGRLRYPDARWDLARGAIGGRRMERGYGRIREGYGYGGRFGEERYGAGGSRDPGEREDAAGAPRGRGPRGYTRRDDRIREDVCDRLMQAWMDADDVEVTVSAGEVTLSGTVPSRQDKRAIEDCALDVLGVRDVHNHLRIARGPGDQGPSR